MLTEIISNEGLEGKHEIFYRNRYYVARKYYDIRKRAIFTAL